jgi:hypothetical protein
MIDSKRFYLYGFSRSAFFTSLLANRIERIAGIILHSGAYDLNRFYHDTPLFRSMLNPNTAKRTQSLKNIPQQPAVLALLNLFNFRDNLIRLLSFVRIKTAEWRAKRQLPLRHMDSCQLHRYFGYSLLPAGDSSAGPPRFGKPGDAKFT